MTLRTLLLCLLTVACGESHGPAVRAAGASGCAPGAGPLDLSGSVAEADAKTYQMIPFEVAPGTGRVEISYQWTERPGLPATPLTSTTLDLGLWDEKGYRNPAGFRGWGGSRQGRLDQDKPPVFVQADSADRGFNPGPVYPGTWYAELGIAAVSPQGADWLLRIECKPAGGSRPAADPVDQDHVARDAPGWYHGDFHMHGYHSNPNGPTAEDFIAQARAAKLDFLMVTEYVTGRHWQELGAMQRVNPDLLIWPGREVITYFGHVNVHGETPGFYEYRHGFEDVDIGLIQREAKAGGALFQVNHPTIWPPPLFSNFCRGCYFELGEAIDWDRVDTIEILTGPVLTTTTELGLPGLPLAIENPFLQTALDLWDDLLTDGHKITAVSGSDSKGVDPPEERARKGYGSSATAVYAENLSRPALKRAIQAGHAYVRTRGAAGSPALEFAVTAANGRQGTFGDSLTVTPDESVRLRTTVTGAAGQLLSFSANGSVQAVVPILSDPFVDEREVQRQPGSEGPLGTFWRVETRDLQSRTAIGNPVFLRGP